ncbi:MAG: glycoside hydrolase family 16 protein, partial [Cyclobacteriaceae bacterium]
MKARYYCLLLLSFFYLSAQAQTPPDIGDESDESSGYFLVWSDEFDGTTLNTTDNWFHQTQLPTPGGWFNGELQHYTDAEANSSVSNGNLSITAIKETLVDQSLSRDYTSARLNSKFAFTYGRVDVRAQLPPELGTWPAIWMLGTDIDEDGGFHDAGAGTTNGGTAWPAIGEIDILEQFANKLEATSAIHTTQSSGDTQDKGATDLITATTDFHIYSIIWDESTIQFLVDNQEYWTYDPVDKYGSLTAANWPFDSPQYLLLNVAMGGIGGTIDPNFTSASMDVDYVRVYQQEASTVKLPLDFELASESYTFTTFGNSVFEVGVDPDNAGNSAMKMTRAAGTNWWSGGTVALEETVDATTGTFSMDVYSNIALDYV